jgi:inosose dehydratase
VPFPPEYPYSRVLDEIAQAGYSGTELGPYGFLPDDAALLHRELEQRRLALCSAFAAFPLEKSEAHPAGFAHVERTASLISQAGSHLLILSDEVGPDRSAVAGRPEEANRLSWTDLEWKVAESAVREVVRRSDAFRLKVAFHHHVGTHVETPEEVERLFSLFPSSDLGLCLDTGHYLYGGGDPLTALERYRDRLLSVHLKDIDEVRLSQARGRKLNFYAAVRSGVFARLGGGVINFRKILDGLKNGGFGGWIVAEQDVLEGGQGATTPLANATAGRQFLRKLGY